MGRTRPIRRLLAVALAAASLTTFVPDTASAAPHGDDARAPVGAATGESMPDELHPEPTWTYLADGTDGGRAEAPTTAQRSTSAAAATTAAATAPANTDFAFSFAPGVTSDQRRAFTAAGGVWSSLLDIQVPVRVAVASESLGIGILGGANATDHWRNNARFPEPDVWFTSALANQFAGTDLDPGEPEIDVVFSSDYSFYEGADDQVPPGELSLLRLAIHELAHGMGHATFVRPVSGGYSATIAGSLNTFDRRIVDRYGRPIGGLSRGALSAAVTDRLLWSGPQASPNRTVKLHSPSPFEKGSSVSHLDENTYGGAILTPVLAPGESSLSVGALSTAMMADMLWGTQSRNQPEAFVTALTLDFLNRYPTPPERAAVAARVSSGTPRDHIARSYANSDEWIGALVDSYYASALGRAPDDAGRTYWIRKIREGLEPSDAAAYFYASDEFFKRSGGTNRRWVRNLYDQILHRAADDSGLTYWSGLADRGTPRSTVAVHFYQSLESRRDRVQALYRRLLGRAPEPNGHAYWSDVLIDNRDVEVALYIAAGAEYYARANRRFR